MTRTNSSRCFRVAIVLLVVASLAAPAAAVTVGSTDVPDSAQVGTQVSATVTLTDLYRDPQLQSWELQGRTDLRNVTWVVSYIDQTGARTGQDEFTGRTFSGAMLRASEGTSQVRIRITGTVPPIRSYSYDPPQQFLLMSLNQTQQGGATNAVGSWRVHHYTPASKRARQALDDANASIQGGRGDMNSAKESFGSAVDAYEGGNFDNAENLANRAKSEAQSANQSSQTRQTILYVGAGVVVLVVLVGGVFYWRSNQGPEDPLG